MRRRSVFFLILLLAGVARAGLLDVGDRAPDVALPLPNGQSVRLSQLVRSGPVLVRFAATG